MNNLLILIFVAVITIVGFFIWITIFPQDNSEGFQVDFTGLSFVNSPNLTCILKSESHALGNQGKLRTSATPFFTTTPFLQYEITGRNDPGDIKDQFLIELEAKCDDRFTSGFDKNNIFGTPTLLPTTLSLFVTATDSDGSIIEFKKITTEVKQVKLRDNFTPDIIASFLINADSIEKEFSETLSPYNSQISFEIGGELKFKFADLDDDNEWELILGRQAAQTGAFVTINKIKEPIPDLTVKSSVIVIEKIEQVCKKNSFGSCEKVKLDGTRKKLDTSKLGERQVKITGVVRDWTTDQGAPRMNLKLDSNSLASNIAMKFSKFTDFDNKDAEFTFLYVVPQNTPDGKITATMTLAGRDNPSTRFFYVEDQSVETTIDPVDFKPDKSNISLIPASLDIKWELFYLSESGEKVDRGVIEGPSSPLNQFAFVKDFGNNNQNSKLQTIRLSPYHAFDNDIHTGKFSATDSDLVFKVGVNIDGERLSLGEFSETGFVKTASSCIRDFEGEKQCSNFGFPLGFLDIQARNLDEMLSRAGIQTGTNVEINIQIDGSYEMKDEMNELHIGSAKGAQFNYPIQYKISGTDGGFNESLECLPGTTLKALSGGGFTCIDIPNDGENACETDSGFSATCLDPDDRPKTDDKNNNGLLDAGEAGCFDIFGNEVECNPDTPLTAGEDECVWMNTQDGLTHACTEEEKENARSNAPTNCFAGFDELGFCNEEGQTGEDNEILDDGNVDGTNGNAGICNGTILQCASALDDLLDSQKEETDYTLFGVIAVAVTLVIALIVYAKRGS